MAGNSVNLHKDTLFAWNARDYEDLSIWQQVASKGQTMDHEMKSSPSEPRAEASLTAAETDALLSAASTAHLHDDWLQMSGGKGLRRDTDVFGESSASSGHLCNESMSSRTTSTESTKTQQPQRDLLKARYTRLEHDLRLLNLKIAHPPRTWTAAKNAGNLEYRRKILNTMESLRQAIEAQEMKGEVEGHSADSSIDTIPSTATGPSDSGATLCEKCQGTSSGISEALPGRCAECRSRWLAQYRTATMGR